MGKQRTIKKPANFDRYVQQEDLRVISAYEQRRHELLVHSLRREQQRARGLEREAKAYRTLSPRKQRRALKKAGR